MAGLKLAPEAWVPAGPTLTRVVVPARRSKTKTSLAPLVSPGTRSVASEAKATTCPSAETAGAEAVVEPPPDACSPPAARLTRLVAGGDGASAAEARSPPGP